MVKFKREVEMLWDGSTWGIWMCCSGYPIDHVACASAAAAAAGHLDVLKWLREI